MRDDDWFISPTGNQVSGHFRPGFYRTRLVKGGPFVPVRLREIPPAFGEDGEPLWDYGYVLTVNGEVRDAIKSRGLAGEPISEADYRHMLAMREHALAHEPDMPEANPDQPVDFNKIRFNF